MSKPFDKIPRFVAFTTLAVAAAFVSNFQPWSGEPVQAGPLVWQQPFAFVSVLVGILLVCTGTMVRAYRSWSFWIWTVLFGAGLGLAGGGIVQAQLLRPQRIDWFATVGQAQLPELDLSARRFAKTEGRPILYYFRADWCAHCPDFERYTLGNPMVAEALKHFVVVRMDLTDFDRWQRFAHDNYGVTLTPSLAFRTASGELSAVLVEGDTISAARLKSLLLELAKNHDLPQPPANRSGAHPGHSHAPYQLPDQDLHRTGPAR